MASTAARAVFTRANGRHALSSAIGIGLGLGAMAVLPTEEMQSNAAPSDGNAQRASSERERSSGAGSGSKDELQLVQVVFRHGARTPLGKRYWPDLKPVWDVCGTDVCATSVPISVVTEDGRPRPHNPDDEKQVNQRYEGGCSKGELTLIGQQQALEFGRWMRWRYAMVHGLLPDEFQEGVVNARTTNYSRTIATLQGVLSGLFPGTKQPIPVNTTEEIDEVLYTNVKSCRRLHTLLKGLQQEIRDVAHPRGEDERTQQLDQRVRAALGLPADEHIHYVDLHDALTTLLTHGKEVPAGLRDEAVLRGVNEMATARFMHVIAPHPDTGKTQEVLRLGMGVLMEMMVRRMEAAAVGAAAVAASSSTEAAEAAGSSGGVESSSNSSSSRSSSSSGSSSSAGTKLYLYSGHDSSLMPLLAALGMHVTDWPPYLSNLALELWKRPSGDHYVKVLYNRQELPLTALCGSASCDLQMFKDKVIGPYLLTRDQHQKECMLHFLHDRPAGEHVETEEVAVGSSFQDDADGQQQKQAAAEGTSRDSSTVPAAPAAAVLPPPAAAVEKAGKA